MTESKVRFLNVETLLNTAPGNYLILLPDAPRFTIAGVTDNYLLATDTQRENIVGKGLFDVLPDNPQNPLASGEHNLRASLMYVLEHKTEHRMGHQHCNVVHPETGALVYKVWNPLNKPVLAQDGTVQFIIHCVEDVTEQLRLKEAEKTALQKLQESEEELRKSKERFLLLNQATQDAIWDWDLITGQIWWNEGFKTLFGYKDEDIEPGVESWYNRLHPDDKERIIGGIHKVIDHGGKHWSDEYRFRKADGSYAIVFDRGYALHNKDGKPYRMLGSMIDITEQKKMENAAKESEARTRLAIESARLGTYEINLATQTIIYSPRLAEIFGLDPSKQWPYKKFVSCVYPDDVPVRNKAHELARRTGELLYEVRIVLPDKSLRWVRLNGALTYQGNTPYLIGTVLDISEEKKAAEVLEHKIEERTKELKQANDQLKQFAYAASHDLQEPLRKISYFIDRLLNNTDTAANEENKRIADRIQQTTRRMRTLIDDLLDYSNTSLARTVYHRVDLNSLVQEVLDDMEATILQKEAVIDLGKLPVVHGDERQLKQLFQNLISNALKYQKKDEAPRVQIQSGLVKAEDIKGNLPQEKSAKIYHVVEVRDQGIGFDQEDAERIFGLFHRLHGKAEYEGTGVGLAIVQKVVENHQGYITAESEPDKGATFRVFLPVPASTSNGACSHEADSKAFILPPP